MPCIDRRRSAGSLQDPSGDEDIEKVDDPHLKAMFETSAEVISGLEKALSDDEQENEAAWREPAHDGSSSKTKTCCRFGNRQR
jgi:hypothetical protein